MHRNAASSYDILIFLFFTSLAPTITGAMSGLGIKCKNAPSTPPIQLLASKANHETAFEKENTLTNDHASSLSASATATATATATAVPTASAATASATATASADVDDTLSSKRPSRVAQHSSQPGYWRIVKTCREVFDLCGGLCSAEIGCLDPLSTSICAVGWRASAGGWNSAPVNCSNSVHPPLSPCPSVSDILVKYLDIKYGKRSKKLSQVRVSHFRQAVMRYSKCHPVVKLFCIFLSLPTSSSSSSSATPAPAPTPALMSSNVKEMDGLKSTAKDGAGVNCQYDGGVCDNGDEELLFLLSLDCRQRMTSGGALVCKSPIMRELHTLSRPYALDSTRLTDALPSPLSAASPLMPTMQLVRRYLLLSNIVKSVVIH